MAIDYISEDEFWDEWKVKKKLSGELFEYADVKDQPINNVWTILESSMGNNDNWYASPGFHYVNRLGYVLTRRPWIDECQEAIYFLDSMERRS
jgi:hypothetical protein